MDRTYPMPFPDDLLSALLRPRTTRIDEHWIRVNPSWWNEALDRHGIPGSPLQVTLDRTGQPGISRRSLFAMAGRRSDDGVLALLVHVLAWGGGPRQRLMLKRLDSIAADLNGAELILNEAADAAHSDPVHAYELLCPAGQTRFKFLGPAFFTKFLYFAGAGVERHPCLILDKVTAGALRSRGWDGLKSTGWSASTYGQYCDLLSRWAKEAERQLDHPVAGDEVERWLFQP